MGQLMIHFGVISLSKPITVAESFQSELGVPVSFVKSEVVIVTEIPCEEAFCVARSGVFAAPLGKG